MKRTLISTVYNEGESISRWIDALKAQTVQPDEFVIVDGGSTDETLRLLSEGFEKTDFPKPHLIVQRCNIAEGRNLAVRNSTHEIIAAVDAGSIPDQRWFEEITRPFEEHSGIDVVGGRCPVAAGNDFQQKMGNYGIDIVLQEGTDCSPSSRNIAFTRRAWAAVGGYPEWLTLTAEDSLFNENLHFAGMRFYHQPSAIVSWEMRPDLPSYLKMMRSYGYGSAEAGQHSKTYRKWLLTALLPPLILISPNPPSDALLRYRRNAASARGWIEGKLLGRKPPPGWKHNGEGWMSPETLAAAKQARS